MINCQKLIPSSKKNPCRVCGRTKDGDCRISLDGKLILCHTEVNRRPPGEELNDYIYGGPAGNHLWGKWVAKSEDWQKSPRPVGKEFRYAFCDKDGNKLVAEVRRYLPDGSKKQWMDWKVPEKEQDTSKLVPYRYAESLDALRNGAEYCFIVEGPPKADALWSLGLASVSFANGFKPSRDSNWYEGFEHRLVVVPDRDRPGVEKAGRIQKAYPMAAIFKPWSDSAWWEPEWLPESGGLDVKDWVDQLHQQGMDDGEICTQILTGLEKSEPIHPEVLPLEREEPSSNPGKQSKVELLLAITNECQLFHTPDQVGYADVWIAGARHTLPIRRSSFRRWLTQELYQQHQTTVGSESLQQVIDLLDARANFEGPQREVYLRTAEHEGRIYIDLCNDQWQVIEVSADGWRVVSDAPVRFTRTESMLPLPTPKPGGKLADLRQLVNVSDADWILLISFILFALTPIGSKPLLMITGEAGGGKSTLCRWLQELIDPCKAPLLKGCPDARDMAVIASRRWLLTIDNLSSLSNAQSDDLCRLATGGGFITRRLFTDDEMTCIEYRRPAVVNAIDAVATRGDLIDRSLMITFNRIPDDKRLDEAVLEAKFRQIQPYILGCLLDGMVTALRNSPTTKLERTPRMADFARFAVAAETGLGFAAGDFLKAYAGAAVSANQTAVESSPLASAIERFMADRSEWSGTPSRLLEELSRIAPTEAGDRAWPRSPVHLTRQVNRLATILQAVGIKIVTSRTESARLIRLEKLDNLLSLPSSGSSELPEALSGKASSHDSKHDSNPENPDSNLPDLGLLSSTGQLPSSSETCSIQASQELADSNDSNDSRNPSVSMQGEWIPQLGDLVQYRGRNSLLKRVIQKSEVTLKSPGPDPAYWLVSIPGKPDQTVPLADLVLVQRRVG